MDWLEEKAEQLQQYLKNASLTKSLAGYYLAALTGALCCYLLTRNLCRGWIGAIVGKDGLNNMESVTLDGLLQVWDYKGELQLKVLLLFYRYCSYFYFLLASLMTIKVFIAQKINPAVEAIRKAMNYAVSEDYSHGITYLSEDEMGEICRNFEEMRKRLIAEKHREWKDQEEQRKINAAFAHDLRTPLTIILGYTEFLQKYVPQEKVSREMLLDKLAAMRAQEERLLTFSETMTTIQAMEKREVKGGWMTVPQFISLIKGALHGMAEEKEKRVRFKLEEHTFQEIMADVGMICEVFDNLLGNALRYAKKEIDVELKLEGTKLFIFVKDDGPGFSELALRKAAEVYYSEAQDGRKHFGIGLSICKMLCERHGGTLSIVNSVEGGAIVCASFAAALR